MSPLLQQYVLEPVLFRLYCGPEIMPPLPPGCQTTGRVPEPGSSVVPFTPEKTQQGPTQAPSTVPPIEESQRKTQNLQNAIDSWDRMFPPDWADSFGTFGD